MKMRWWCMYFTSYHNNINLWDYIAIWLFQTWHTRASRKKSVGYGIQSLVKVRNNKWTRRQGCIIKQCINKEQQDWVLQGYVQELWKYGHKATKWRGNWNNNKGIIRFNRECHKFVNKVQLEIDCSAKNKLK